MLRVFFFLLFFHVKMGHMHSAILSWRGWLCQQDNAQPKVAPDSSCTAKQHKARPAYKCVEKEAWGPQTLHYNPEE